MKVTRTSVLTGVTHTLEIPCTPEQLAEFEQPAQCRRYIQDIMPDLTPSQREFLISGTTDDEWNAAFPEE